MASRYDLFVDRWTLFERFLTFPGFDLTGATLTMQVRVSPDAPGDALISLANVTSDGSEGFFLTPAGPTGSQAHLVIAQSTLANPAHAPASPDHKIVKLAYDLWVTLPGGQAKVWLFGDFNIVPGVTRAS